MSEAFDHALNATPALEPIYKAKRPNDLEGDFSALHLLLHSLPKMRTEVSHAWAGYKEGGYDLIAASITTNTAVDLSHSVVEGLKIASAKHGGASRMLQIFHASQCVASGTSEAHKQRPADDMNFAMFKVADALMWPAYLIPDAFSGMHKVNPHAETKTGFYGTYSPSSNRDRKSDNDKFMEDKILLLEILPEF
ncbi:uncharacterized protein M421DRAFT_5391 [Didymella exigua CBS 183.55]|uniref:DUF6604 domain-containing protein n=1 Tax=Didymella exigua CBS 183.55 TaxID=1150837 RepID=A0A6A5RM47_9PLEO|nr:uncharacterized protein M421DRAFT_5391 [Didymella exigua CBS 183.55]KAF1928340.1 hypothetical protein M421DRAFT_5391 [Didymella exigua CBS 183.55]